MAGKWTPWPAGTPQQGRPKPGVFMFMPDPGGTGMGDPNDPWSGPSPGSGGVGGPATKWYNPGTWGDRVRKWVSDPKYYQYGPYRVAA